MHGLHGRDAREVEKPLSSRHLQNLLRRILCERPEGAQTKFSWSKERIPGFPGRRARRRVAVSLEDLVATAWQHAQ